MTVPVNARGMSMAAVSFPAVLYRRDVVTFSDTGGLRMKTVMLGVLLWQLTTAGWAIAGADRTLQQGRPGMNASYREQLLALADAVQKIREQIRGASRRNSYRPIRAQRKTWPCVWLRRNGKTRLRCLH
ncbi:UNVERIFIED_ORG: hypothetical protein GGR68_004109 [Xanthomonas campestris]